MRQASLRLTRMFKRTFEKLVGYGEKGVKKLSRKKKWFFWSLDS